MHLWRGKHRTSECDCVCDVHMGAWTDLLYRASNSCWEACLAVTGRDNISTHVVYRTKRRGPENSPKCQLHVGTQTLKGWRPGEEQWRGRRGPWLWGSTFNELLDDLDVV